jgi:uncharacterized protein (DUF1697 family)
MRDEAWIVLLRGVNVGGRNRLPMADLARCCDATGAVDIRTYIQSGHVVLRLPGGAGGFARQLRARLLADCGVDTPVVMFRGSELGAIRAATPFGDAAASHLHYAFLSASPTPEAAAALDPNRSPGDRFHLRDRVLYLHLPHGVARTKLTNPWIDRTLGVVSTIRNRQTVDALAQMVADLDPAAPD